MIFAGRAVETFVEGVLHAVVRFGDVAEDCDSYFRRISSVLSVETGSTMK